MALNTAFHNQDFFNKSTPSCDYTNTLWLALPSVPVTQYRYHYEKIDKGMCNGVTAYVTRPVTLIVCILGVVILGRARLYQNVVTYGRVE